MWKLKEKILGSCPLTMKEVGKAQMQVLLNIWFGPIPYTFGLLI